MRQTPRAFALVGVLLSGCTYVSRAAFEDRRDGLDEDGDGSAWENDCDDRDESRSPELAEIPYDGIDNDCGGDGDVLDLDNDTYPGIAEEDYPGEYPARYQGRPVDCLDDPAQHPKANEVFPGSEDEVPYDGLDSDCDGSNDFDNDGDGYMPQTGSVDGEIVDVAEAYAAYVTKWGFEDRQAEWGAPAGQAVPALGDCHDSNADIHPDPALPDVWYDGEDTDCNGANDFDADADGWMPPILPDGTDTSPAYVEFITFYFDGNPPWTLPDDITLADGTLLSAFSDCLDETNPAIRDGAGPADPADIHPEDPASVSTDLWYDGLDTNCWADNDFDADLDAHNPDQALGPNGPILDIAAAFEAYVQDWEYEDRLSDWAAVNPEIALTAPQGGDCKDDDPQTWPGALETLDDQQIDQDCDGSDATAFAFNGYGWDAPSPPRITRMGDYYVLAVTAAWAELLQEGTDVGEALFFEVENAGGLAVPAFERAWKTSSTAHRILPLADVVVDPTPSDTNGDGYLDPGMWFVTTYTAVGSGFVYLYGTELHYDSQAGQVLAGPGVYNFVDQPYTPESVEIGLDPNDEPYLFACGDDALHVVVGLDLPPTIPELQDLTPGGGGVCFLEGAPRTVGLNRVADLTRCGSGGCNDLSIEGVSSLVQVPGAATGESWTAGNWHDDVQILRDSSGVILRDLTSGLDYDLFTGETVLSVDGMIYDGEVFAVAVLDIGGTPTVRLAYGTHPALTEVEFPYVHPTLPDVEPAAASLYVDEDRVAIAVTGADPLGTEYLDAVGWVFLGH